MQKKRREIVCLFTLIIWLLSFGIKQVQEKKIKKISEMNIDPSREGSSSIPPQLVTNGLPADKAHGYLSNEYSFPPGGIPSLRLPVVVVLKCI